MSGILVLHQSEIVRWIDTVQDEGSTFLCWCTRNAFHVGRYSAASQFVSLCHYQLDEDFVSGCIVGTVANHTFRACLACFRETYHLQVSLTDFSITVRCIEGTPLSLRVRSRMPVACMSHNDYVLTVSLEESVRCAKFGTVREPLPIFDGRVVHACAIMHHVDEFVNPSTSMCLVSFVTSQLHDGKDPRCMIEAAVLSTSDSPDAEPASLLGRVTVPSLRKDSNDGFPFAIVCLDSMSNYFALISHDCVRVGAVQDPIFFTGTHHLSRHLRPEEMERLSGQAYACHLQLRRPHAVQLPYIRTGSYPSAEADVLVFFSGGSVVWLRFVVDADHSHPFLAACNHGQSDSFADVSSVTLLDEQRCLVTTFRAKNALVSLNVASMAIALEDVGDSVPPILDFDVPKKLYSGSTLNVVSCHAMCDAPLKTLSSGYSTNEYSRSAPEFLSANRLFSSSWGQLESSNTSHILISFISDTRLLRISAEGIEDVSNDSGLRQNVSTVYFGPSDHQRAVQVFQGGFRVLFLDGRFVEFEDPSFAFQHAIAVPDACLLSSARHPASLFMTSLPSSSRSSALFSLNTCFTFDAEITSMDSLSIPTLGSLCAVSTFDGLLSLFLVLGSSQRLQPLFRGRCAESDGFPQAVASASSTATRMVPNSVALCAQDDNVVVFVGGRNGQVVEFGFSVTSLKEQAAESFKTCLPIRQISIGELPVVIVRCDAAVLVYSGGLWILERSLHGPIFSPVSSDAILPSSRLFCPIVWDTTPGVAIISPDCELVMLSIERSMRVVLRSLGYPEHIGQPRRITRIEQFDCYLVAFTAFVDDREVTSFALLSVQTKQWVILHPGIDGHCAYLSDAVDATPNSPGAMHPFICVAVINSTSKDEPKSIMQVLQVFAKDGHAPGKPNLGLENFKGMTLSPQAKEAHLIWRNDQLVILAGLEDFVMTGVVADNSGRVPQSSFAKLFRCSSVMERIFWSEEFVGYADRFDGLHFETWPALTSAVRNREHVISHLPAPQEVSCLSARSFVAASKYGDFHIIVGTADGFSVCYSIQFGECCLRMKHFDFIDGKIARRVLVACGIAGSIVLFPLLFPGELDFLTRVGHQLGNLYPRYFMFKPVSIDLGILRFRETEQIVRSVVSTSGNMSLIADTIVSLFTALSRELPFTRPLPRHAPED